MKFFTLFAMLTIAFVSCYAMNKDVAARGYVASMCYAPQDDRIVVTSSDGVMRIFDAATGNLVHDFSLRAMLLAAAFCKNSNILVSCEDMMSSIIKKWDLRTGEVCHEYPQFTESPTASIALLPEQKQCIQSQIAPAGNLVAWNYREKRQHVRYEEIKNIAVGLAATYDQVAISNDQDGIVILDRVSGRAMHRLSDEINAVLLSYSYDGSSLAGAGKDTSIKIWNPQQGTCLNDVTIEYEAVTAGIALNHDGSILAYTKDVTSDLNFIDCRKQ